MAKTRCSTPAVAYQKKCTDQVKLLAEVQGKRQPGQAWPEKPGQCPAETGETRTYTVADADIAQRPQDSELKTSRPNGGSRPCPGKVKRNATVDTTELELQEPMQQ